jgi:hypothetical protein
VLVRLEYTLGVLTDVASPFNSSCHSREGSTSY